MSSIEEIQKRIDAMPARMSAKGLVRPDAEFNIVANAAPFIWLKYKAEEGHYIDTHYERIEGKTIAEMLDAADAFIAALPSAEETKFKEFMGSLGRTIDLGKTNGIEVEFLNPLVATMKKLSENAITYERASP